MNTPCQLTGIPAELRAFDQWVLWRTEIRDGKPTKVPYSVTNCKASTTNATTWTTFDQAAERFSISENFHGIGFVFTHDDPFIGIDFDGCRDPETGKIAQWANLWINKLATYTEVSPSGTGVKLFGRGRNPLGSGKNRKVDDDQDVGGKRPGVELYGGGRYFAVTGCQVEGTPKTIEEIPADVLTEFCSYFFGPAHNSPAGGTNIDRTAIVDRCRRYVEKMPPAIAGNRGHDAAFNVACELFRFGLTDAEALVVFSEYNARCEPPWNDREIEHKLNDARERTIRDGQFGCRLREERVAIDGLERVDSSYCDHGSQQCDRSNTRASKPDTNQPVKRLVMVRLSVVQPQSVEWLWQDRLAVGKVTLLAGDPGNGKSTISMSIAAAVTRGTTWPDHAPPCQTGSVVILSAEDGIKDTIRPRLDAAGADVSRVHAIQGVAFCADESERVFNVKVDAPLLVEAINQIGDVRLVIVDPVSSFLDGVDSNKNGDVRSALQPLVEAAERSRAAILMVTHLSKAQARSALAASTGSLAFGALARQAHIVLPDPDDESRRLFLCMKSNICQTPTGLAFTLGGGGIAWESAAVNANPDAVLRQLAKGDGKSKIDEATTWLETLRLDLSPRPASEVETLASSAGLSWRTVQRAFDKIGGRRYRTGFQTPYLWTIGSEK